MVKNKEIKILYIHHDMGSSGASRSLSFLLDKLDSEHYNAKVHCIFGGPVVNLFQKKGVEISSKRGIYPFHGSTVTGMSLKLFLTNLARLPQSVASAYKIIKEIKPDLIHLNSSCLFSAALAAKMIDANIKVICHIREPLLKYSISAKIMNYMNYLFVDHYIAIDHYSGSSMKTRNNMSIVHNSVNFEEYNSEVKSDILRTELGLNNNDVIFLYLARISKSNGALELVKVANKLSEKYPNFHFVLAGFKEILNDKYSKEVVTEGSGNKNIHFMKFRNDIPDLISSTDIMIVPFTEPHFARSIVEASAMGKPTIGANIGGVNELVVENETGFLFDNEQELYDYCILLGINQELRMQMGISALQFAKKNFDNNNTSKKVFEIYNSLLAS